MQCSAHEFRISSVAFIKDTSKGGPILKKHIFISIALFVITTPSLAKNIFLDELTPQYNITDNNSPSPYTLGSTSKGTFWSGDKCTKGKKEQFRSNPHSNTNQDVECYITDFPESSLKTRMQSNEDGDVNVSFSWDLD